ncbi:hypothetical protein [Bradyrhizobium sp. USDA 3256]
MNDNATSIAKAYRLTFEDAVYVWLRHWRGEYQHHIAASYNVNPGRVNEVLKERIHFGSRAEATKRLQSAA